MPQSIRDDASQAWTEETGRDNHSDIEDLGKFSYLLYTLHPYLMMRVRIADEAENAPMGWSAPAESASTPNVADEAENAPTDWSAPAESASTPNVADEAENAPMDWSAPADSASMPNVANEAENVPMDWSAPAAAESASTPNVAHEADDPMPDIPKPDQSVSDAFPAIAAFVTTDGESHLLGYLRSDATRPIKDAVRLDFFLGGQSNENKDQWPHFGARFRIRRKVPQWDKNQVDYHRAIVLFDSSNVETSLLEKGTEELDQLFEQRPDDAHLKKYLDLEVLQRVKITWDSSSQVALSRLPWPFVPESEAAEEGMHALIDLPNANTITFYCRRNKAFERKVQDVITLQKVLHQYPYQDPTSFLWTGKDRKRRAVPQWGLMHDIHSDVIPEGWKYAWPERKWFHTPGEYAILLGHGQYWEHRYQMRLLADKCSTPIRAQFQTTVTDGVWFGYLCVGEGVTGAGLLGDEIDFQVCFEPPVSVPDIVVGTNVESSSESRDLREKWNARVFRQLKDLPGWLPITIRRPTNSGVKQLPSTTQIWLWFRSDAGQVKQKIATLHRLMLEKDLQHYRTVLTAQAAADTSIDVFHGLSPGIISKYMKDQKLPQSQREIINNYLRALPSGIGLVQGPPGCGKTTLIAVITALRVLTQQQTLICAPSNYAVDRVVEALESKKLHLPDNQPAIVIRVHALHTEKFNIASKSNLAAKANPSTQTTTEIPAAGGKKDWSSQEGKASKDQSSQDDASAGLSESKGKQGEEVEASQPTVPIIEANDPTYPIDEVVAEALLKATEESLSTADAFMRIRDKRFQREDLSLSAWMLKVAGIIEDQTIAPSDRWTEFRRLYLIGVQKMTDEDRTSYKSQLKDLASFTFQIAHVVVSTCAGAMTEGLRQSMNHDLLIVDEASTATDLDILLPWIMGDQEGKAETSLILVGDHEQLPPTVLTANLAKDTNFAASMLGYSLFKRLINLDWPARMLREQFRMTKLSSFLSNIFYPSEDAAKIVDQPGTALRNRPLSFKFIAWANEHYEVHLQRPVMMLSIKDTLTLTELETKSRYNPHYAAAAIETAIEMLRSLKVVSADIMILTPYRAQLRLYRKGLAKAAIVYPDLNLDQINLRTVDGAQGWERQIVIADTVVSASLSGNLGFITNRMRLNVMLSRHQSVLIVIGDVQAVVTSTEEEEDKKKTKKKRVESDEAKVEPSSSPMHLRKVFSLCSRLTSRQLSHVAFQSAEELLDTFVEFETSDQASEGVDDNRHENGEEPQQPWDEGSSDKGKGIAADSGW